MKLIICILLMLSLPGTAQINFGSNNPDEQLSPPDQGSILTLRGLTLLFMLPETQLDKRELYERVFEENWTWSKSKVISSSEIATLPPGRYATLFPTISKPRHTLPWYELSLEYVMPMGNGKQAETVRIAAIELAHEADAQDLGEYDDRYPLEEVGMSESWHLGRFLNISPGWMRIHLQVIQRQLENEQVWGVFDMRINQKQLQQLRSDTLYVSSLSLSDSRHTTASALRKKEKQLFSEYPFPYRVTDEEETDALLLGDQSTGVLFSRFKIGEKAVFQLYNLENQRLIYSSKVGFYSSFRNKHISEIVQIVKTD